MSEARMADMAVIDAALINPRSLDPDDIAARKEGIESGNDPITDQHEPIGSPISAIAKELSAEESKTAKTQEQTAEEQLEFQQKQQSLLKQKVQATGQSAGRAIGSIQNGLGSVSMPGGLLTPLLILIVFLMLLVRVNGHTRLSWLWLVATQNAAIPGPGGATSQTKTITDTSGNVVGVSGDFGNTNNGTGGGMPSAASLAMLRDYVPLDIDEW